MTLREFGRAASKAISAVTKPIGDFLRKHWVSTAVVMLGLVVFAAVITLLVFAWPAFIGAAAAATMTLPLIGTVAPLAFLSSLSIPAAAAVLGSFAFAGFIVASGIFAGAVNLVVKAYNAIDNYFTGDLPNENRDRAIASAKIGINEVAGNAYDAGFSAASSPYHRREFKNYLDATRKPVNVGGGHYSAPVNFNNPNPFVEIEDSANEFELDDYNNPSNYINS
ncbi:MAG: hypothetical protein H0U57_08715 [Tatlockia sp.]|nr:hypothetical protein [Tatlockia sp.]